MELGKTEHKIMCVKRASPNTFHSHSWPGLISQSTVGSSDTVSAENSSLSINCLCLTAPAFSVAVSTWQTLHLCSLRLHTSRLPWTPAECGLAGSCMLGPSSPTPLPPSFYHEPEFSGKASVQKAECH